MLKQKTDAVFSRLSRNVKVAGFRPGKAPRHLVETEIGQDRINAEVLDAIIPEVYYQAVVKEDLNVVGSPEVKLIKFVPTDGLTFEAIVELLPEVKVPDLAKIEVKRSDVKVSEKDVQEVIDDLAKQLAKTAKAGRPAKKGDQVEIDFEGFVDNVAFEGGKSQNYPLILGQGQFVPGFEDQLIGMGESDEKEIEVTFPKDYHAENLKNKKAKFKIKMNVINEVILPDINDDFAKQVGPFNDVKQLKEDIKKELRRTKEGQERNRVETEILEKITSQLKVKVPDGLVHQEVHRLLHEAEHNLSNQGMTIERYLEMSGKSQDDLEKEMIPEAEKRVKIGLVLTEISKEIKAVVSEAEVHAEIERRIELTRQEEKPQAEEFYRSPEGHHQIENILVGEKVVNYLYDKCSK